MAEAVPPIDAVAVRMYRGILGDCFLIRIGRGGVWRHILIDCGVLQNVASGEAILAKLSPEVAQKVGVERLRAVQAGPELIRKIAEDVVATVGKKIDLLVLTHEHFDHFSGFALAEDVFTAADVSIGGLWLAWTEDPGCDLANKLRKRFETGKQAMALAAKVGQQHQAMGMVSDDRLQMVAALAEFLGPVDVERRGLAAAPKKQGGVKSGQAVIQMLKDKAGIDATRYLRPGQIVDALGLKAYVLGPPMKEERLEKDKPSSDPVKKEVYLTTLDGAMAVESTMRVQLAGVTHESAGVDGAPFALPHLQRNGEADSEHKAALRRLYLSDEHRKIDHEWTAAAEALALKMDSDTNNTSLALAFELEDGQVLLFPGDAQVGNWLSWHDQTYPPKVKAGRPPPVTANDLLRRTTFYKVGHHASHNATLRQLGLEKMIDPRLTAAIPVVQAVAEIQGPGSKKFGKGWKMPYGDLYTELMKRTKSRVVKGDGVPAEEKAAFAATPTDTKETRAVTVTYGPQPDPMWVELMFPLPGKGT